VYAGAQYPAPSTNDYVLVKNATVSTAPSGNYAVFEISELLRDYLYTDFYVEAIDCVWVYVEHIFYDGLNGTGNILSGGGINYYLAVDGFGYFEEGINPRKSIDPNAESYTPMLLQDNLCIYFIKGKEIKLPFWSETEPDIVFDFPTGQDPQWDLIDDFWNNYNINWNSSVEDVEIGDSTDSLDKIVYLGIAQTDGIETGDTATITSTVGNAQSVTVTFIELCELKYTPVRIIFYNKYGALQDLWASKKSTKTLNQSADKYKANIIDMDTLSYSKYKHTEKRFNVQAQESISVSTAYLSECINEPVKQLLMSEQVWLEIGSETYPVVLTTSSVTEKTSVNDKLVAYTFEFNFASDKIQNVR
jgi:hypothetical protein